MHLERKILVVDGDIHLGKFLKRQLGHKNHRVDIKTNGKDAGDELRGNSYDLLILELNLPDLDGIDLIKKIHAALPSLPILVLTARNRAEDIVRGLDEGADDYLTKPFCFMELAARVQVLLSRNYVALAAVVPTAGGLTIDMDGHQAFRGGRRIDSTAAMPSASITRRSTSPTPTPMTATAPPASGAPGGAGESRVEGDYSLPEPRAPRAKKKCRQEHPHRPQQPHISLLFPMNRDLDDLCPECEESIKNRPYRSSL